MTRLNHERPSLRIQDNLKRELNKWQQSTSERPIETWPPPLHPLGRSPRALGELAKLFEELETWLAEPENPAARAAVLDQKNLFLASKAVDKYDGALTIREWLYDTSRNQREPNLLKDAIIAVLGLAGSIGEPRT